MRQRGGEVREIYRTECGLFPAELLREKLDELKAERTGG